MPQGYEETLTPLERMLLLRCFRVDRIYVAITKFVMIEMGQQYVQPPVLDFMNIFKDSTPLVPIIFVLSPGADPQPTSSSSRPSSGWAGPRSSTWRSARARARSRSRCSRWASQRGHWVLLQNCHLLPKWLKTLEKILEQIKTRTRTSGSG